MAASKLATLLLALTTAGVAHSSVVVPTHSTLLSYRQQLNETDLAMQSDQWKEKLSSTLRDPIGRLTNGSLSTPFFANPLSRGDGSLDPRLLWLRMQENSSVLETLGTFTNPMALQELIFSVDEGKFQKLSRLLRKAMDSYPCPSEFIQEYFHVAIPESTSLVIDTIERRYFLAQVIIAGHMKIDSDAAKESLLVQYKRGLRWFLKSALEQLSDSSFPGEFSQVSERLLTSLDKRLANVENLLLDFAEKILPYLRFDFSEQQREIEASTPLLTRLQATQQWLEKELLEVPVGIILAGFPFHTLVVLGSKHYASSYWVNATEDRDGFMKDYGRFGYTEAQLNLTPLQYHRLALIFDNSHGQLDLLEASKESQEPFLYNSILHTCGSFPNSVFLFGLGLPIASIGYGTPLPSLMFLGLQRLLNTGLVKRFRVGLPGSLPASLTLVPAALHEIGGFMAEISLLGSLLVAAGKAFSR